MKSIQIYIALIGFGLFAACNSSVKEEKNEAAIIVGKWKAKWTTDPSTYPDQLSKTKKFTMDGELSFTDKGALTINAYGYENCIFSSDTMKHSLNWKIQGDTLSFFSGKDPYGIPYKISKIENDEVELLLMDDINIKLTRTN